MKARGRLDEHLVQSGYFADLREAQAWILRGKVLVDGSVCSKAGTLIRKDAVVSFRGMHLRYASRGGYKLEKALSAFGIPVEGKVALDAGAASGGFTDCLLQHGARCVYAVDVGFGQLRGKLAADPRVINWERVNISDVARDDLEPPIDLCTADLSFLSLATALPILKNLFVRPYVLVCLIKPLFEGLSEQSRSDPDAITPVLLQFFRKVIESGISVSRATVSPIYSSRNTVEFLMLADEASPGATSEQLTAEAMRSLVEEPPAPLLQVVSEA